MADFLKTPSFYNNEEVFKKFPGQTSYYLGLQEKVAMLTDMVKAEKVLELGFGAGHTAIKAAKQNKDAQVTAVDVRPDMVIISKELAKRESN